MYIYDAAIKSKIDEFCDFQEGSPKEVLPSASTREDAYVGTLKFKKGTVGYGVNLSIGAIKYGLGTYGQAKIGDLFNRADVQELLAKENTDENNYRVARLEYEYWIDILSDSNQSVENRLGALLGSVFMPTFRKNIQMVTSYSVDKFIDPTILSISSGADQLKEWAKFRMKQIENTYKEFLNKKKTSK